MTGDGRLISGVKEQYLITELKGEWRGLLEDEDDSVTLSDFFIRESRHRENRDCVRNASGKK